MVKEIFIVCMNRRLFLGLSNKGENLTSEGRVDKVRRFVLFGFSALFVALLFGNLDQTDSGQALEGIGSFGEKYPNAYLGIEVGSVLEKNQNFDPRKIKNLEEMSYMGSTIKYVYAFLASILDLGPNTEISFPKVLEDPNIMWGIYDKFNNSINDPDHFIRIVCEKIEEIIGQNEFDDFRQQLVQEMNGITEFTHPDAKKRDDAKKKLLETSFNNLILDYPSLRQSFSLKEVHNSMLGISSNLSLYFLLELIKKKLKGHQTINAEKPNSPQNAVQTIVDTLIRSSQIFVTSSDKTKDAGNPFNMDFDGQLTKVIQTLLLFDRLSESDRNTVLQEISQALGLAFDSFDQATLFEDTEKYKKYMEQTAKPEIEFTKKDLIQAGLSKFVRRVTSKSGFWNVFKHPYVIEQMNQGPDLNPDKIIFEIAAYCCHGIIEMKDGRIVPFSWSAMVPLNSEQAQEIKNASNTSQNPIEAFIKEKIKPGILETVKGKLGFS